MTSIDLNRFSTYALWEDIFKAISDDYSSNKTKYTSYTSPIITGCLNWIQKLGPAIKQNDTKSTELYLYNIDHYTSEAINNYNKGRLPGVTDGWMRPYYELFQASQILTIWIDEISS